MPKLRNSELGNPNLPSGLNRAANPPRLPEDPPKFTLEDERMASKHKQHRNSYSVIRRFAKDLREFVAPDVDILYKVAQHTDWHDLVDYNLKTFINSYLTKYEKELFAIAYRQWMIIEVEQRIMNQAGGYEEEEEFELKDNLEVVVAQKDIAALVKSLGHTINEDHEHIPENLVMLGVLKGAALFYSDLVREIERPVLFDFIEVSSYRNSTRPSDLRLIHGNTTNLEGCHVIIVEDIIDTGQTMNLLLDELKKFNPRSIKVCTLLDKPSRREEPVDIHYCGIRIPDVFVVGYGLDYCGHYRNLKDVCRLE